jgi:mRNA-degrading endonuclease HigB of HigAB toxin-antitoxin module
VDVLGAHDRSHESPTQLKNRHRSADFVKDNDIGGNKYRLIVRFRYARPSAKPPLNGIALVKFIGTHQEYDAIDIEKL